MLVFSYFAVPAVTNTIPDTHPSGSDTESIDLHDSDDTSCIQIQPRHSLRKGKSPKTTSALQKLQTTSEEITVIKSKGTPLGSKDTPNQTQSLKCRASRIAKNLPEESDNKVEEVNSCVSLQKPNQVSSERLVARAEEQEGDKSPRSMVPETILSEVSQNSSSKTNLSTRSTEKKAAGQKTERSMMRSNLKSPSSSSELLRSPQLGVSVKRRQKSSPESLSLKSLKDSSNQESEKMLISPPVHYRKTFMENHGSPKTSTSKKSSQEWVTFEKECGSRRTSKRKSCPQERNVAESKPSSKRQRSAGVSSCGFSEPEIQLEKAGTRQRSQRIEGLEISASKDIDPREQLKESENIPASFESNTVGDGSSSFIIRETEESAPNFIQVRRKSRSLSRRESHIRSQTSEAASVMGASLPQKEHTTPGLPQKLNQKSQEIHKTATSQMTESPNTNYCGTELGSQSLFDDGPIDKGRSQNISRSQDPHPSFQNNSQETAITGQFQTASEGSPSPMVISPASSQKSSVGSNKRKHLSKNCMTEKNSAGESQNSIIERLQKDHSSHGRASDLTHKESLHTENSSDHSRNEPSISSSSKSSKLSSIASLSIPYQGIRPRPQDEPQERNKAGHSVPQDCENLSFGRHRAMSDTLGRPLSSKTTSEDFVSASEGASISPDRLSGPIIIPRKHHEIAAVAENGSSPGTSQNDIASSQSSPTSQPRKRKSLALTAWKAKQYRKIEVKVSDDHPNENSENIERKIVEVDITQDHSHMASQNHLYTRRGVLHGNKFVDESCGSDCRILKDDDKITMNTTKDRNVAEADLEEEFDTSGDVDMVSAEDEEPRHDDENDDGEEESDEDHSDEDSEDEDEDYEDEDEDVIIPPTPPCQSSTNLQTHKRPIHLVSSSSSLARSTSIRSSKSLIHVSKQDNAYRLNKVLLTRNANQSLKDVSQRINLSNEKTKAAVTFPEKDIKDLHFPDGEEKADAENFERRFFPLNTSPVRHTTGTKVLKVIEQSGGSLTEDASENGQSLSIFQGNVGGNFPRGKSGRSSTDRTFIRDRRTRQQGEMTAEEDGEELAGIREDEDEKCVGTSGEVCEELIEGRMMEEAKEIKVTEKDETDIHREEEMDQEAEDVMLGNADHHYDSKFPFQTLFFEYENLDS